VEQAIRLRKEYPYICLIIPPFMSEVVILPVFDK
jgi:hypothetical protein